MIYCVVPQALADELLPRLTEYYKDDPHVEVIVDRRAQGGSPGTHDPFKAKRRQRARARFPPIGPAAAGG